MAGGLADLFGGGGMFGGGLDELLTPQMKQQMAMRGLMAAAGAFGQAAMPSRMPIPIGAALGQAGAAMSGAQDQGLETALKMLLTSGKLQELKSKIEARKAGTNDINEIAKMLGGLNTPAAVPTPAIGGPTAAPDMGGGTRAGGALIGDPLALIEKYESGGQNVMQGVVPPGGGYNPSVGRVTGPSTAQGFYQITNTTWRETAPRAGVDLDLYPTAMDAPKEVQAKVAQTLFNEQGFKPWAPYNPRLAAAIRNGEAPVAPPPISPSNNGGLPTRIGMIGEGANAVLADMDTGRPIQATPGGPIQLAQAAPQAQPPLPPSAPQAPPFGSLAPGPDAAKLQAALQALALKNAAMVNAGDQAPYGSLISVLQGSPQFQAAQEAAKAMARVGPSYLMPDANPALQGQIAGARRGGEHPYDVLRETLKADLDRRNAFAQQGRALTPEGTVAPIPNFNETAAATTTAVEGAKPTDTQRDYSAYVKDQQARGGPVLSFGEWDSGRRRAGATMINTAEGLEAAQTKARIAIDTKAAQEIGEQALTSRRLMPVVDELTRLADKTPEGYAGPLAASAAKAFSSLGLPVSEGMSNAEAMLALSQRLVPLVREPGATSQKELDIYLRSVPGLLQSEPGRKKIAEVTKTIMQRSIEIAGVYRQNVGAPDLFEKLSALDKPIMTDAQRAEIERLAGASSPVPTPDASGVITTPYGTIREVK